MVILKSEEFKNYNSSNAFNRMIALYLHVSTYEIIDQSKLL